jgi:hypothetical protein
MADGLTAFLGKNDPAWSSRGCTVTVIKPEANEAYWGAIRLDVAVYSVSGLIRLRKVMKKQVEMAGTAGQAILTRKPVAASKLYSMDVEAQW